MKRFSLTIDLQNGHVRTYTDVIDTLDALLDRLKLFGAERPPQTGGDVIRDTMGNVVGCWEIREDTT